MKRDKGDRILEIQVIEGKFQIKTLPKRRSPAKVPALRKSSPVNGNKGVTGADVSQFDLLNLREKSRPVSAF